MTSLLTTPKIDAIPQWQPATWDDYVELRDSLPEGSGRIFFNQGWMLLEMGEGINHARFTNLLTLIFFVWFSQKGQPICDSLGGCVLEKAGLRSASPDAAIYLGGDSPQWQDGESRHIDLNRWRVPDLVGEVGDTSLATDLDEKKQIYAALGIPEYWVLDVIGARVLAFRLDETGRYQQIEASIALAGLPIALINQTVEKMNQGMPNTSAAQWFAQQIVPVNEFR
jgi:Uma2 family endonuclease